jgi:hypothetical protein
MANSVDCFEQRRHENVNNSVRNARREGWPRGLPVAI